MVRSVLCLLVVVSTACALPPTEGAVDYDSIFVHDRLVDWKISVTNEDWSALVRSPSVYIPADLTVDGVRYESVGLRLVGNSNRAKLGMRIRFDEFNPVLRFHGVKRINLRSGSGDPTLVREALALRLMREAGIPAPRASFVWLDWGNAGGIYTLVEQVDRRFLEDRFGDRDGNLFKVETGGNLVFRGEDPASYEWATYEAKSGEEPPERQGLIRLMQQLQLSGDALQESLPRVLDVDGLLLLLAANRWLANLDSLSGTARNLYLYEDTSGWFRAIPWDLDRAFGNYHGRHCRNAACESDCTHRAFVASSSRCGDGVSYCTGDAVDLCADNPAEFCPEGSCSLPDYDQLCSYTTDDLVALGIDEPPCNLDRPLVTQLLAVPAFQARYRSYLRTLVNGPMEAGQVKRWMELMRSAVAERVDEDVVRERAYDATDELLDFDEPFYTDTKLSQQDRWEERVPGLSPFIDARDALVRESVEE